MTAVCPNCYSWDPQKGKTVYHMGSITDWKPPPGMDPGMREFVCFHCGATFYKILTPAQVERVGR